MTNAVAKALGYLMLGAFYLIAALVIVYLFADWITWYLHVWPYLDVDLVEFAISPRYPTGR